MNSVLSGHSLVTVIKLFISGTERYDKHPEKPGFIDRLLALTFDLVIVAIPFGLIQLVSWIISSNFFLLNTYLTLFIIYKIIATWLIGSTFGKKQLNIKVQSRRKQKPNLIQATLREIFIIPYVVIILLTQIRQFDYFLTEKVLVNTLSIYFILFFCDVLWVLGKSKNTLHDIISKTYCYSQ